MVESRPAVQIEELLVDYLGTDAVVVDELGPMAASTELPRTFAEAPDGSPGRIRITRLGGAPDPRDGAGHVDYPRVQVDVFAATRSAAGRLAGIVHERLKRLPFEGYGFPGAEVTDVRTNLGPRSLPDSTTSIPGYMVEVVLTVAPVPD